MLAYSHVLGDDASPKINPKSIDRSQELIRRLFQTPATPISPDGSAYTAPEAGGSKLAFLAVAALFGGATYYTLTRTTWGAKQRTKLGLGGRR